MMPASKINIQLKVTQFMDTVYLLIKQKKLKHTERLFFCLHTS